MEWVSMAACKHRKVQCQVSDVLCTFCMSFLFNAPDLDHQLVRRELHEILLSVSGNAEITLHNFSPDIYLPTGFAKLQTNARNQRQIGACSRE